MTDIPALDAAVNEANAKVAELVVALKLQASDWREAVAAPGSPLDRALDARMVAIATRAAADKPLPLSAEEAQKAYDKAITIPCSTREDAWQAVLDAAAERWVKVLEAELEGTMHSPYIMGRIRFALKPGGK